jgi:hypothetical protein
MIIDRFKNDLRLIGGVIAFLSRFEHRNIHGVPYSFDLASSPVLPGVIIEFTSTAYQIMRTSIFDSLV